MPLGEQGGLKVGGTYRDRDGYYDNLFTRKDNGFVEYAGFNAALDLDVTPWLNVVGIVDIIRQEGGGSPVQYGNVLTANILSGGNPAAVFGPTYNARTGSPTGLRVLQVQNNFADADELDMDIYNLTATIDTPFGQLVSTTAYIDSADLVRQDFDGTCSGAAGCPNGGNALLISATNPPGTLHTIRDQEYDQFTEELRLSGTVGQFDYLLGVYYFDSELDFEQFTNSAVLQRSGEEAQSLSFFGNLDWRITPRVTVSAGVRNVDEDKDFRTRIDIPAIPLALVAPIKQSDSWNETITRFAAEWQATDQSLFYISRSEGFRSGGFSIRGTLSEQQATQSNCATVGGCPNNNFLTYDPETVTAYEVGSKNAWIDNRLIFNVAIFKTEVEDFQQSTVVVTPGFGPGTNTYVNNLPKVEIEGLEFELVMRPTFMWSGFDGLTLSANLGLQDGKVTDGRFNGQRTAGFPNGAAGAPGSTANATGNALGRVPDYNVGYRASWEFPVGPGTLTFGAGYNYIDDFVVGAFGTTLDIVPGYSLVDANIDFETDRFRIALTGKNLTDEEYRVHSLPTVFFQGWGDPMTWAVEVSAKF
jgi:iron complex outermembrane receptor protein